ncbi:MAG: rhomboid family intramembrane serine protease [Flavobacteriales bacterium]|nr:rhomboid family intramembrane serine protease [Flavobacteriales bacterium]
MNRIEKIKIKYSIIFPTLFVALLWGIWLVMDALEMDPAPLGMSPRTLSGLIGILTSPLMHDPTDLDHLISNSFPLLVLGGCTYYFYRRVAFKVFFLIYALHGILLWLMGRPLIHIGASGLVYGLTCFLFFAGILRKDRTSVAVAMLVTFLYGSMMWGIFPLPNHVSWEAHLFGSVIGSLCAFLYWNVDLPPEPEWMHEEEEDDDDHPYPPGDPMHHPPTTHLHAPPLHVTYRIVPGSQKEGSHPQKSDE